MCDEVVLALSGCELSGGIVFVYRRWHRLFVLLGGTSKMASNQELASDQRFSQVTKDPRFWEMPEKESKIKIDKRFRAMFHDKKFNLKYTVDKRGRPIHHSTAEDLKRFYDLSESEESNLSDAESKEMALRRKKKILNSKGKSDLQVLLDHGQPKKESNKAKRKKNDDGSLESTYLSVTGKKSSTKTDQAKKVSLKVDGENVSLGKIQTKDDQELSLLGKQKQNYLSALKSDVSQKSRQRSSEAESRETAVPVKIKCRLKEKIAESEIENEAGVHEDHNKSHSDEKSLQGEKGIGSEEPSEDEETEDESVEELEEASDEEADSDSEEDDESDGGSDLARGRGNVETSSEDEDEELVDEDLVKEVEFEHAWRELDKTTTQGDQITRRLAVCNMDWDRLKAKDLLTLFNSFKPKGGVVFSVKIYPSEYGKERLKQEELRGPVEFTSLAEDVTAELNIYREKMREYQFSRLKYFYAVVECDSPGTANKIYEECDGLEFESSCSFVDLRFIPDDITFDDKPKDTATDVDIAVYKPKYFTSAAMATSKVEITWDETDHDRMTTLNKTFKKDEILDMDFQAYLASSSEEEEEQFDTGDSAISATEDKTKAKKSLKDDDEQIAKYKELLKSIQEKDKKCEDNDMEMEIKWVPGLKESTEKMVKDKLEGKDMFTPWEQFLQKKKEKKKFKKKKAKQEEILSEDSDELAPEVNFNDPYFSEELGKPDTKRRSRKDQKEKKGKMSSEEEADQERHKAEMALLLMDDEEDGRKHFNYEKIVEQQNLSKKKKQQLMKTKELLEDDFQMDVADKRFQSMYTSHLFNVDPSDPSFRKTKAMGKILAEKARRRALEDTACTESQRGMAEQQQKETAAKKPTNPALSLLIKSVKSKTEQFQARKNKKSDK